MRYRRLIPIVLLIALVAVLWPHTAHAVSGGSIISSVLGVGSDLLFSLLDLVRVVLNFIRETLMGTVLSWMGNVLQSVINLKLTYGGPAVYQVWKVFRDMCNMLFIVLFILVAFSTIFNSFLKSNPFFYSRALKGILLAAILMNFSLAIGQTIVWAGNYATGIVIQLLPGNVAAQIAVSINLEKVGNAQQTTPTALVPQVGTLSMDTLTQGQQDKLKIWYGLTTNSSANVAMAGNAGLSRLKACLQAGKEPIDTCFNESAVAVATVQAGQFQSSAATAASAPRGALQTFSDAWAWLSQLPTNGPLGTKLAPLTATNGPTDIKGQIGAIVSLVLSDFLLLVLALSYLAVIAFSVVRIPAIWFLLAFSAGAFFTIALPNAGAFKKWFNNLLGWCIFSPLYLFVIYLGTYFISQSGSLTASLSTDQSPFFAGMFANVLLFGMVGFIFIGGATMVWNLSFKTLSPAAGAWFGKTAGKWTGVSPESLFGIKTIAQKTSITPNVQALGERVKQQYGDVTAGLRGRAPGLFGSKEEAEAAALQRFGVREGGIAAVEKLEMTRIKEERERIEGPLKQRIQAIENLAAQAVNPQERAQYQEQIKQLKGQKTERLRTMLRSGNRDTAFAAAEMLMEDDQMSPDELRTISRRYAEVSPAAQAAFIKRRDTNLNKGAAKHKFKDAADLEDYLSLFSDPKQAEAYYKAVKGGKSKIVALEVGANEKLSLEKKSDGNTYTFSELAQREAPKFNSDDWLATEDALEKKAEAARKDNPNRTVLDEMEQISPEFRDQYAQRFFDPKAVGYMMASASKEQKKRILTAQRYAELPENAKRLKRNISQARRYAAAEPAHEKSGESEKKEAKEEKGEKSAGEKKS